MNKQEEKFNSTNKESLKILLEYCKHLYDEESNRTKRIEQKINIQSFILGGGVLVIFGIPIDKFTELLNSSPLLHGIIILILLLFFTSTCLFLFSSIFTILVYRVRIFERLCDPKIIATDSVVSENTSDLLSKIIADYVIAANRNHEINNKKANYLSKALFSLLAGIILFVFSIIIFKFILIYKGI